MNEQRLAMSGLLLEEESYAEAGCLAGAQGTIFVSYGCIEQQNSIEVKMVDCSTSDLYWSATGLNSSVVDTMNEVRKKLF